MPKIPNGSWFGVPELGNNRNFFSDYALAIGGMLDLVFV